MKKLIIGVDVDDTIADMLPVWRDVSVENGGRYFCPKSQVRDWSFSGIFETPEERGKFYTLLSTHGQEMYQRIRPVSYAQTMVGQLREAGHRVIFVTSCASRTADFKFDWLVRWGFLAGDDHGSRRDFFPVTDKSLVRADILVDDSMANVNAFPGHALLVDQPHNQEAMVYNTAWKRCRVLDLREVQGYVRNIQATY